MQSAESCNYRISEIQKLYVYQTYSKLYIIGSNSSETKFCILKIDRSTNDLIIHEEQAVYNFEEIKDIIQMIDIGNKTKFTLKHQNLFKHIVAYGIVGFVKFLFGYYIILITKKSKIGIIGHHIIYKIEESQILYIPTDQGALQNSEEQRFLRIFQSIDLSSNFYYSYSIDITHSLQYNYNKFNHLTKASSYTEKYIGYCYKPSWKYVWNRHLLKPWKAIVNKDWLVYLIHGYLKQHFVKYLNLIVGITLIARRSSLYAGTRYLKRGASLFGGFTANSVETEQIIQNFSNDTISSYVQYRGSVPVFWSQEISKMVPKPPIVLTNPDPFCSASGAHFHRLFRNYGSPIIVLNLAKENKRGEGVLTEEYVKALHFLNRFLPTQHKILYYGFDMARLNRDKEIDVLTQLENLCRRLTLKTGYFYKSNRLINELPANSPPFGINGVRKVKLQTGVIRTNCVDCLDRTNTAQFIIGKCALALQLASLEIFPARSSGLSSWPPYSPASTPPERQFVPSPPSLNKSICEESKHPTLYYDAEIVRILEELYEEQGDVLALQYGGSQLVHRVDTYRKISPSWTYQSRDMMQTFSRYYSNTFSDSDKQDAINLFLGAYIPSRHYPPAIWDMTSDFHLHNTLSFGSSLNNVLMGQNNLFDDLTLHNFSFTRWYDPDILTFLPYSIEHLANDESEKDRIESFERYVNNRKIDILYDYYKPYEYTNFDKLLSINAIIADSSQTNQAESNDLELNSETNMGLQQGKGLNLITVEDEFQVFDYPDNETNYFPHPFIANSNVGLYQSTLAAPYNCGSLVSDKLLGTPYALDVDDWSRHNELVQVNLSVSDSDIAFYQKYLTEFPTLLDASTRYKKIGGETISPKEPPVELDSAYEVTLKTCDFFSSKLYRDSIDLSGDLKGDGLAYLKLQPPSDSLDLYRGYVENDITS